MGFTRQLPSGYEPKFPSLTTLSDRLNRRVNEIVAQVNDGQDNVSKSKDFLLADIEQTKREAKTIITQLDRLKEKINAMA